MADLFRMIKAYLIVCRYEYFPGELIALFIPILIATNSFEQFYSITVIEGVIAFILLYLSGFLINAWTDRDMDAKYQTFKTSIAWGVNYLGEKRLKTAIAFHLGISIILGAHICYRMGDLVPMVMILAGIFFGFGYSMKPFSFKTRGVLYHILALGLCCFFIPLVFMFYVVSGGLTLDLFLFAFGFTMVHYALEIGNQIQDYEEDLSEKLLTPIVRLGLKRSLGLALIFFMIGLPLMVALMYIWFNRRGSIRIAGPVLNDFFTISLISIVIFFGYLITIVGLFRMYREANNGGNLSSIMERIRSHINYAMWQISGVSGLFTVSILLFSTG
ncbi:MAG: UbiA family prenyltransferase [Thermoplasmatota archaeon]